MRVQVGDIVSSSHKQIMKNFSVNSSRDVRPRKEENSDKAPIKKPQPQPTQNPPTEEASTISDIQIQEQERQFVVKAMLSKELTEALKGLNLTQGTVQNSGSPSGSVPTAPSETKPQKSAYTGVDPLYLRNSRLLSNTNQRLTNNQAFEMKSFVSNYLQNKQRYEKVAQATDMPAELIAALHWRESSGNFGTYLHQGDPLGKPARHIPNNIPVFNDWESAAIHALSQKNQYKQRFGITRDTSDNDTAALLSYAEYYNGKGYYNRNQPSPYVFSGSSSYSAGKYVADGKYDPNAVDKQLGVYSMLNTLWGLRSSPASQVAAK
jgi:lysozyme family protein